MSLAEQPGNFSPEVTAYDLQAPLPDQIDFDKVDLVVDANMVGRLGRLIVDPQAPIPPFAGAGEQSPKNYWNRDNIRGYLAFLVKVVRSVPGYEDAKVLRRHMDRASAIGFGGPSSQVYGRIFGDYGRFLHTHLGEKTTEGYDLLSIDELAALGRELKPNKNGGIGLPEMEQGWEDGVFPKPRYAINRVLWTGSNNVSPLQELIGYPTFFDSRKADAEIAKTAQVEWGVEVKMQNGADSIIGHRVLEALRGRAPGPTGIKAHWGNKPDDPAGLEVFNDAVDEAYSDRVEYEETEHQVQMDLTAALRVQDSVFQALTDPYLDDEITLLGLSAKYRLILDHLPDTPHDLAAVIARNCSPNDTVEWVARRVHQKFWELRGTTKAQGLYYPLYTRRYHNADLIITPDHSDPVDRVLDQINRIPRGEHGQLTPAELMAAYKNGDLSFYPPSMRARFGPELFDEMIGYPTFSHTNPWALLDWAVAIKDQNESPHLYISAEMIDTFARASKGPNGRTLRMLWRQVDKKRDPLENFNRAANEAYRQRMAYEKQDRSQNLVIALHLREQGGAFRRRSEGFAYHHPKLIRVAAAYRLIRHLLPNMRPDSAMGMATTYSPNGVVDWLVSDQVNLTFAEVREGVTRSLGLHHSLFTRRFHDVDLRLPGRLRPADLTLASKEELSALVGRRAKRHGRLGKPVAKHMPRSTEAKGHWGMAEQGVQRIENALGARGITLGVFEREVLLYVISSPVSDVDQLADEMYETPNRVKTALKRLERLNVIEKDMVK